MLLAINKEEKRTKKSRLKSNKSANKNKSQCKRSPQRLYTLTPKAKAAIC